MLISRQQHQDELLAVDLLLFCRQHQDLLLAATQLGRAVSFSAGELTAMLLAALPSSQALAGEQQLVCSSLALLEQALLHVESSNELQRLCQQHGAPQLMEVFLLPGLQQKASADRWVWHGLSMVLRHQ